MLTPLRVLILEDRPDDAELLAHELRRAGFDADWRRAENEPEYLAHLEAPLDLILADYSLPEFDAIRALQLLRMREVDIPLIVVTGSISEDAAVECIKLGAADYLLKDRLARLGSAVRQALTQQELRSYKRMAEAALQESEERFRAIFHSTALGIAIVDLHGRLIMSNPAFQEMLGYTGEELQHRAFIEYTHPDDTASSLKRFNELVAGECERYQIEKRYVQKGGRLLWVRLSVSLARDANNAPQFVIVTVEDITTRRQADETRARLAAVVDSSDDAIISIGPDRKVLSWNRGAEQVYGYAAEEIVGQPAALVLPANRSHEGPQNLDRIMSGEGGVHFESRRVRKDGRLFDVALTISPIKDSSGQITGASVIARDITVRKQADEARARLAAIVASSDDAIFGTAPDGTILSWNAGAERIYGYTSAEVIGQPAAILAPPALQGESAQLLERLRSGERISHYETTRAHKDGRLIDVALTISLIKDAQDNVAGFSTIARGISERKRAEQTLHRQTAFVHLLQVVAVAANEAASVEDALQTAIDQICAHIGWPVGHVYLPDPETPGAFMPTQIWHLEDLQRFDSFRKITEAVHLAPRVGLPGRALATRKPAWISDMILDPTTPRTRLIRDIGVRASFAFPVLVGDEVTAVLEFFSTEAIEPDEELLDVMAHVGAQLGRIFERTRAEHALRESEERFRVVFEYSPDAILLIDPHHPDVLWPIVGCNAAACRMNGYTREELIGRSIDFLQAAEADPTERAAYLDRLRSSGMIHLEAIHRRKDSTLYPLDVSTSLITQAGRELIIGTYRDITERKQAEEALARYQLLSEHARDIILFLRHDGQIIEANQAALVAYGYTRDELLASSIYDLRPVEAQREVTARMAQVDSAGILYEATHRRKDGQIFPVEIGSRGVVIGGERVIVSIIRDITERKQAEEASRQAEQRYRDLFEEAPVMYVITGDRMGIPIITDCNEEFSKTLGYSRAELLEQPLANFYTPDSRDRLADSYPQALSGVFNDQERELVTRNGRVIQTLLRAIPGPSLDGRVRGTRAMYIDITERKQTEEALRAAEAKYRTLVEQIPAIIYTAEIDERSPTSYVSPQIEAILGFSPDEWMADPELWLKQLHPDDRDYALAEMARAQSSDEPIPSEYRVFTRDGRIVWLRDAARVVRDRAGRPLFIQGISLDISERKRAEQRSLAFAALGRQLGSATTAEAAARVVADMADDLLGWDAFVLNLYSADTNTLRYVLSYDIVDGRRAEVPMPSHGMPSPMAQRVFKEGPQLLTLDDPTLNNLELVSFGDEERPSASSLFVPIRHGETAIGILSIQSYTPQAYTAEDLATLQSLADHCNGALERIRVAESLRESENLYRMLWIATNDAMAMSDANGIVLAANPAYIKLYGYPLEEVVGRSFATVFPPEQRVTAEETYKKDFETQPSGQLFESIVERTDGVKHMVEARIDFLEQGGRRQAMLSIVRDITERKRAEDALAEERALLARRVEERTADLSAANADLARGARLKDEFLASMSHELRTPLNAVLGLSEALQEQVYGLLNDQQCKALRTIEESGRHLLELINDILDLAKVGAGKLELDLDIVAIESLCQASVRLVKQDAHKKQIVVSTAIDPAVTALHTDARRLKQILVNLLSNAVKFTPAGGKVGLEVAGDAAQQAVHLTVWDTGIGIANEDLARLFQPFVQLDSRLARQYSGTGLGLALVYRMVEMHGGSVRVTSEPGAGSRFTVSLPWRSTDGAAEPDRIAPTQELTIGDRAAQEQASALANSTILLAEDNEASIASMSDYLGVRGYQVVVARNGAEAVTRASELQPALILMDIQMPGMDGMEATRRIRAQGSLVSIPIIALTALAMPGDRERCLEAGADDYLSKPVSLKGLAAAIETLLRRHAAEQRNPP